jgi:hypothetical protein
MATVIGTTVACAISRAELAPGSEPPQPHKEPT